MTKPRIRTAADIKQLGTILSVWAHPDDETFSCGGIMSVAAAGGQTVVCVTATKGEAGVQDESRWPAARLGEIREAELNKALEILGAREHFWLDYKDGHCHQADQIKAIKQVRDFITQYQPDSIFTFGPEGMTGHSDHKTVSLWVSQAVAELKTKPTIYHAVQLREIYEKYLKTADENFDIFFNIDEPPLKDKNECDICLELPPGVCSKKCQALAAMPSQTEGMVKGFGLDNMQKAFAWETFIVAP